MLVCEGFSGLLVMNVRFAFCEKKKVLDFLNNHLQLSIKSKLL